MRASLAGTTFVAVALALAVAAAIGIGNGPLPREIDGLLVELVPVAAGQPVVEMRDDGDGDLGGLGVGDGETLVVDADQLICLGGSLIDIEPGAIVIVTAVRDLEVAGGRTTIGADRVEIACGARS